MYRTNVIPHRHGKRQLEPTIAAEREANAQKARKRVRERLQRGEPVLRAMVMRGHLNSVARSE